MSKKYIGNLVQSLDSGSGGGGGGDTGVGKPYPGSTGGEYFNYYGDDSNKNEASGEYSTAFGQKNKSTKAYAFSCGTNNTNQGVASFVFGDGNTCKGQQSIVGGYSNTVKSKNSTVLGRDNNDNGIVSSSPKDIIMIGSQNTMTVGRSVITKMNGTMIGFENKGNGYYALILGTQNDAGTYEGSRLIGDVLTASANNQFIFGRLNAPPTLTDANFMFGCGTNDYNKANFMEASNTSVKILNNLQLNADTTEVNAITAPQDPNNVTTDDQTLATKSYVDANSGGGVGEAYPGSTGGEIFNCYEDDPNDSNIVRNQATGAYSTAIGASNQANMNYSATIGFKNRLSSGTYTGCEYHYAIGYNNKVSADTNNEDESLTIGFSNNQNGKGNHIFGSNNNATQNSNVANCTIVGRENTAKNGKKYMFGLKNTSSTTSNSELLFGYGLTGFSTGAFTVWLGTYNSTSASITNPRVIIGCGVSGTTKNAVEINATDLKILNNLQLATDTTAVNQITAPQDPNNVTQDDKTLVTKSYLNSQIPSLTPYSKSQVAYFEEWDNATIIPVDGSSISLTTFGTIPTWSNRAIITFRWENELITKEVFFNKNEGIHLHVVQRAYSTFPETINYKHMRIEWDYTNNNLTAEDFWTYDQDMSNSGAISNWSHTLSNATTCKILSVVFSE